MIAIYILLGLSVILNLVLLYGVWNLLRKNNAIEELLSDTVLLTREHVQSALLVMENADINKSFESDDEVGVAFQDIKNAITDLNNKF